MAMWSWPTWVVESETCFGQLCSSCWSSHLLRKEFLSAPIHSPSLVTSSVLHASASILLGCAYLMCRFHYPACDHLTRPLYMFDLWYKSRGAWSCFCKFSVLHRSDQCRECREPVWLEPPTWRAKIGMSHQSDWWCLVVQVFGGKSSDLSSCPIHPL
jgi:hypothetical protein